MEGGAGKKGEGRGNEGTWIRRGGRGGFMIGLRRGQETLFKAGERLGLRGLLLRTVGKRRFWVFWLDFLQFLDLRVFSNVFLHFPRKFEVFKELFFFRI